MTRYLKYIVFALLLAYIPMWIQIQLLVSSIGHAKEPIELVEDSRLTEMISAKTGVAVDTIKISESKKLFGMMIGIPGQPQLILSRALYENFNIGELEYVVLHETGHYALLHSVKEMTFGFLLLLLGMLLLRRIHKFRWGIAGALLLGLGFGVSMIQIGKYNELQADRYSIRRLDNPVAAITATEQFRNYYESTSFRPKSKLLLWLFYRGNPYDNRIKMANDEIGLRD